MLSIIRTGAQFSTAAAGRHQGLSGAQVAHGLEAPRVSAEHLGQRLRPREELVAPGRVPALERARHPERLVDHAVQQLDRLAEAYFEEQLLLNPTQATSIGDARYNDRFTVGFSEEQRAKSRALTEKTLAALALIDVSQLDAQRAVSHEMLRLKLEHELAGFRFPGHLQPINQFYNFANSYAQMGSGTGIQPFKSVRDYESWLKRAEGFTESVEVAIANMRKGMEVGVVQPKVLMEKVLPQLAAHLVTDPTQSVYWGPIKNMPASFSKEDRGADPRARPVRGEAHPRRDGEGPAAAGLQG